MTKTEMIEKYESLSGADTYYIGTIHNGQIYVCEYHKIPAELLALEPASRNQGLNLRLRIKASMSRSMANNAIFCLGDASQLTDTIGHFDKNGNLKHWNKGEMFEKILTEFLGQEWHKDTICFTKCGDVRHNNQEIQIKLNGATLANEKTLGKLS